MHLCSSGVQLGRAIHAAQDRPGGIYVDDCIVTVMIIVVIFWKKLALTIKDSNAFHTKKNLWVLVIQTMST